MACLQPEHSLPTSVLKQYLSVCHDQSLTIEEITPKVNLPLFKVRSQLRELIQSDYIRQIEAHYTITDKGREWLKA